MNWKRRKLLLHTYVHTSACLQTRCFVPAHWQALSFSLPYIYFFFSICVNHYLFSAEHSVNWYQAVKCMHTCTHTHRCVYVHTTLILHSHTEHTHFECSYYGCSVSPALMLASSLTTRTFSHAFSAGCFQLQSLLCTSGWDLEFLCFWSWSSFLWCTS